MCLNKYALASAMLLAALGMVGCSEGQVIDPRTGNPVAESELRDFKMMYGREMTQEDMDDFARAKAPVEFTKPKEFTGLRIDETLRPSRSSE